MKIAELPQPPRSSRPTPATAQLDPELVALPAPPARERFVTLLVLLVAGLTCMLMAYGVCYDAAYAWADSRPVDLGELADAPIATLPSNAYASASLRLGAARAVHFERPLVSGSFRLMPLAKPATLAAEGDVWVELHVPPGVDNARWVPPSRVTGRLLPFARAGLRHRGLASAIESATGQTISERSWLFVQDEAPRNASSAMALLLLFSGFSGWCAFAIGSILRRIKPSAASPTRR